jgi:hypothetical protein
VYLGIFSGIVNSIAYVCHRCCIPVRGFTLVITVVCTLLCGYSEACVLFPVHGNMLQTYLPPSATSCPLFGLQGGIQQPLGTEVKMEFQAESWLKLQWPAWTGCSLDIGLAGIDKRHWQTPLCHSAHVPLLRSSGLQKAGVWPEGLQCISRPHFSHYLLFLISNNSLKYFKGEQVLLKQILLQ